jgi:hypothetical protein
MGDYFQRIVDRDVSPDEAQPLAGRIRDWLVGQEIIVGNLTDCVLGGGGKGYPPGANFERVVDGEENHTRTLRTNGLAIVIGRTLFGPGQGGFELICRQCGLRTNGGQTWGDAVSEWYKGRGTGRFACPRCAHAEPVTEWTYDPPMGFGNLGFEFWNWPPLKNSFIAELSLRLGHRTVFVSGKL